MGRPKLQTPNYRVVTWRGVKHIAWTEAGTTRRLSLGTRDENEARRAFHRFIAGLQKPLVPAAPTISAILDAYEADRSAQWQSKSLLWTVGKLRTMVGDLKPENLGRRTYWDMRAEQGVKLGTIIREILILRAALHWAVNADWLIKAPYVEAPPRQPPRERWLTREEAQRLLDACDARYPHVRLFILLGLHTGARRGAIFDLEWSRVDFDAKLIRYERPDRRQSRKRRATVPINDVLLPALREAREFARTDYVIEFGGKRLDATIRIAFQRAVERAGVAPCTPHTLRHTCITWLVQSGVPSRKIARWVADTEETIERVYGHHAPDYLQEAAEALAGGTKRIRIVEYAALKKPITRT